MLESSTTARARWWRYILSHARQNGHRLGWPKPVLLTTPIQNNQELESVSVYKDEGISMTNIRHRSGFNQMISDALTGKMNIIVAKSVKVNLKNIIWVIVFSLGRFNSQANLLALGNII